MPIHASRFSASSRRSVPKIPKFLSRLFVFLLLGMLAVGAIGGLRLWISVSQALPNLPNQNTYPSGTNAKERTNLLLVRLDENGPNYLAVLSISEKDAVKYLPVPTNLLTELARARGSYTLAGAWRLGNLDGGEGLRLMRDSLSRALAIPIDGYLATDQLGWERVARQWGDTPDQIVSGLTTFSYWEKLLNLENLRENLLGSLALREIVELSLRARVVGEVSTLDLAPNLADSTRNGDQVKLLNASDFDGRLGREFFEDGVERAHPRVKIVNSSGIIGAGGAIARYVRNLGGEVISVESGRVAEKSSISDHLGGNSLSSRIQPLIKAEISVDTSPNRADIEIVIGQIAKDFF